jgi:hypothetical protein
MAEPAEAVQMEQKVEMAESAALAEPVDQQATEPAEQAEKAVTVEPAEQLLEQTQSAAMEETVELAELVDLA